jgi:hypothetical protein
MGDHGESDHVTHQPIQLVMPLFCHHLAALFLCLDSTLFHTSPSEPVFRFARCRERNCVRSIALYAFWLLKVDSLFGTRYLERLALLSAISNDSKPLSYETPADTPKKLS